MLDKLIEQFNEINGKKILKIEDLKNEQIKNEFMLWLKERLEYGYRYIDFLYEINDKITESLTAEVDKTRYDSLVSGFDTTIISPYFEDFNSRIMPARFVVYNGEPILHLDQKGSPNGMSLVKPGIDTFITHNPYSPYSIKNWEELHNSGNYDIAVGVYGDIHDKNIKRNLEILKQLRDKITSFDIKIDYNTSGNIYYAAVVSDRKIKELGSKIK